MPALQLEQEQLTPLQQEIVDAVVLGEYRRVIVTAPVRQGKGVGTALAFIHRAFRRSAFYGHRDYLVAGKTVGSFHRNNANYLIEAAQSYGLALRRYSGDAGGYRLMSGSDLIATFHLVGGGNAGSYGYLRGLTIDAAWIDEATECDQQFVQVAEERLSYDGGVIVLTHNAAQATHWLKTEWIDNATPRTAIINGAFGSNPYYSCLLYTSPSPRD